ncbi:MAG: HAD-IA family hydrolase [Chloroflexota bacterium]
MMQPAGGIQAVVWDVDGVLVHPWRFRDALIRDHGIQPEVTLPFFRGPFVECVLGRAELLEILPHAAATWGWPGTARELLHLWLTVEDAPNEAVFALVDRVRRTVARSCVASVQERHRADYLASEMGLADRFDDLFFSCHMGARKPEPAYYEVVEDRLGVPPSSLLLIDDSAPNVDAAQARGWQAELFTDAEALEARLTARGLL